MESSESSGGAAIALIFDAGMDRVAVRSDAPDEPPSFRVPPRFYPETPDILDAIRRETGADCVILRCLDEGGSARGRPRVYSALAVRSADRLRAPFRWTPKSKIRLPDGISLSEPANPAPQAWQRASPEWTREIAEWIADNLPSAIRRSGWTLSQIRTWAISAVFRIESDSARLYFKASPSYFGKEVPLTLHMADEFPDISPRVIASDSARGWMLMEDLGNDTLSTAPSTAAWRETTRALARVQLSYAADPAPLDALGLERRAPRDAVQTLRTWISSPESAKIRVWHDRFADALRRLAPNIGKLDAMRRRLDAIALPQTLDHGDLDSTNIFVRNGAPVLMDWSDAAISHPLFTSAMMRPVIRDPELRDLYLSHWTPFAPLDDLREAFAISKTIAPLERAVHYRANIVPHLPDDTPELRDLERYIPDLLSAAAGEMEGFL